MDIIGNVLKGIGSIASVASNFVPGGSVLGKVLGGVGAASGILGGMQAQGQAQGQANQQTAQIKNIGSALAQMGGIDPKTGAFDPNYNPNAAAATSLFDPSQLTAGVVANREAIGARADNAVNASFADSLGRGFLPNGDSAQTAAAAGIRRDAAIADNGFARNAANNLLAQKNAFLQQGLAQRNQSLSQALGTFGGLQGMYQSQANAAGAGVGAATVGAAKAGTFDELPVLGGKIGSWFNARLGKRKQSTSPGTTNAQRSTPVQGQMSPNAW